MGSLSSRGRGRGRGGGGGDIGKVLRFKNDWAVYF